MSVGESHNKQQDSFAALRYGNFRCLIGGTFLITCALQMQRVALGYSLYLITRDPLSLGLLGLAEAVPFMTIALFGGHLADRHSKQRMMQIAGLIFILGSASLLTLSLPGVSPGISDSNLVAMIYAVVFIEGLARAFYSPSSTSLRPFLIPRIHYSNSATWGSAAWQSGAILGPALGGFAFAAFDLHGTLLLVLCLITANILLIGHIKMPAAALQIGPAQKLWKSLGEGFAYVWRTPIILYSISLDMVSVLFGGVIAILPIFAEDILNAGPEGLGILRAAPAVGATATLLLCTRFPPTHQAWRNLLLAIVGFGASTLAFALSSNLWLSALALAASGGFDSVSVIIRNTILQIMTADHMRGRVAAVNSLFLSSSNELGAVESGVAARLLGTVPSVIFGAVATFASIAYVWRRSGALFSVRL